MGFGKILKGAGVGALVGGPMGAQIGGALGSDKAKDFLLGKKTPGTPDEVIDLASPQGRALQEEALKQYGEVMKTGVGAQMDAQERQVRTGAEDQARKAEELVAQRGLGNSSVGLSAILNAHRDLGDRVGAIRASEPMLKQQNLQFASGGINQILNEQGQSKIFKQGTPAQGRGGGLLGALAPIAGTAIGGFMGGPGGAMLGQNLFGAGAKAASGGGGMAMNYSNGSMGMA